MNIVELKEQIASCILPDIINDWELEEHAEIIADLPDDVLPHVLKQIGVIWPVSHALSRAFLERVKGGLDCLGPSQLPAWVNSILDVYETEGLRAAALFMADVENNFVCRIRGEKGVRFEEAVGRLLPYARGLARRELDLVAADAVSTDTATIYLPREIAFFKDIDRNFLLYKLIVSYQWAFIACRTYRFALPPDHSLRTALDSRRKDTDVLQGKIGLENFFNFFSQRQLAADLFHLAETVRVGTFLKGELPGLMRESAAIRNSLLRFRPDPAALNRTDGVMEMLKQWVLAGKTAAPVPEDILSLYRRLQALLEEVAASGVDALDAGRCTLLMYETLAPENDWYAATEPLVFQGYLKPAAARTTMRKRREEAREQFIRALALLLPQVSETADTDGEEAAAQERTGRQPASDSALLMPQPEEDKKKQATPASFDETLEFITINDRQISLPEEMKPLLRDIQDDLGHIPAQYISSAFAQAGSGVARGAGPQPEEGESLSGATAYDEWDYRRSGFRKNWCMLLEKNIVPVKGTFVAATLEKYRGQLVQLRRQFEMMRTQDRFARRQRYGDDIDFDALTEALADAKAGLAPSERLFIRLLRDERNIAAVFLVDMSSSTEGWISTAIKESLVLMCEALTVLGDRYAIYGFSGMRRLRSDFYHVKHLDEPYSDEVKGRIAAISPQEYTRMGPPIRHLSRLLAETDAKVRLLITLSDGKPEDYDDYKGDYAIEDTRHALIEAKNMGVHPFCITIDKNAHDYIAHMYGEVNYIFINDVFKLPQRMPEIYRTLTT